MMINDAQFESLVLRSESPVIVAFVWSLGGFSDIIKARLKKVLNYKASFIQLYSIDNYVYPKYGERFSIKELPSFIFFYKGFVIDSISGVISEGEFEEKVNNLLCAKENIDRKDSVCADRTISNYIGTN